MKNSLRTLALAVAVLPASGAFAGVTVHFEQPEHYQDMPWSALDREQVLKDLSQHFGRLAAQLPPGLDLKVDVLDLDLAGRVRPFHTFPHEVRILKGDTDWPHMQFRFSLVRDGKVVASGEEHIKNMMYRERLNRYSSGDALRYEKQMMDDWFKDLLKEHVAAR